MWCITLGVLVRSIFWNPRPVSECSVSIKLNFFFSPFTGASNARFDGMVETSMTFSTCVVYNIWCLGTFNFLESKAIALCRSAIFAQFRSC